MTDFVVEKDVAAIARQWIGTPYHHQASCRGAGTDCLGLVLGIWRELCGAYPEEIPDYTFDWSEASGEERLWSAAERHLRPSRRDLRSGDILLFRMRQSGVAKHLGICSGTESFIHAYCGHGVVESRLSAPWRRKIVARYQFPTGDG